MKKLLRERDAIRPFLKWPGGKRWFVAKHLSVFPNEFDRLIEPFLGSGCVFFGLGPKIALLGDLNRELIDAYRGVKYFYAEVEDQLDTHSERHSELHYYTIRHSRPRTLAAKAARFIYLNRTCFNGIYRVNRNGIFNVPIGTRDTVLFDGDNFASIAKMLKSARLYATDFEPLVDLATSRDVVFADPPYTVRHNLNGFLKYNEVLFSWSDQVRLAKALKRAVVRGAKVICTNAAHDSVETLYQELGFDCRPISRFSPICADGMKRKLFSELLITSPERGQETGQTRTI